MLLKKLINNIPKNKENIKILGLSTNSNEVKKNYIFFAIKGNKTNGENFIEEAISKGASVIVCSTKCNFKHKNILVIRTKDLRYFLSKISSRFYKNKPKNIFAVTGTNGKTSVADLFYQILRLSNKPAASIGTLGVKYYGRIIKTKLTSPDTISLHKTLEYLKKKKIDNVIIEASSHGLDQKRLHNIKFKAAIFTNFSQDHLDYHKNMRSYLNAKLILFKKIIDKNSSIISDKNIQLFVKLKKIAKNKKIKILDINNLFNKVKIILNDGSSDFKYKNLAMAAQAARLCGLKQELIFKTINRIKDVNGRLELIKQYPNDIKVFVDYAHTPDALLKTLKSLIKDYGNNISIVFGCGGNRDRKKRPLMAKIANGFCKKIYLTDDNPRNENPKKIRDQLSKYINKDKKFIIGNRALAIKEAIKNSEPQEIILIAGKGHEEQQIYKNKIYNISDKKIVRKLKIKKKIIGKNEINNIQNKLILSKVLGKKMNINFNGLSIDSRSIRKNNLFLAIKGKKNDGNKFIKDAFKNGAACVASTSKSKINKTKFIKINNSISFLNNFGKLKREQSLAKIIAVTGSAGKTSLKNLIMNLLKPFGKTYSSPRSFNNHYGVPVSLSNLSYNDEFGIFEVGMSRTGEIRNLTKLIKPQIGIITNVGEAHIENFRNTKGIANAKSEIIENIQAGGTIILNRDDKFFNFLSNKAKLHNLKIASFGKNKKSDVYLKKIIKKNKSSSILVNFYNKYINFKINDLNIYNILASLAVMKELNIDVNKLKSIFKNIEPSEGRGKKHLIYRYKKKFVFIDESYNANPLSVKNAIERLDSIKKVKSKKYLILGDMLELGSKSKKYHELLSRVINNSDIDKVFIKGKKTIFTYKHLNKAKRGNILQNNEDIDLVLNKLISNNDYLMIKGSNATGLNYFSKRLIKGN